MTSDVFTKLRLDRACHGNRNELCRALHWFLPLVVYLADESIDASLFAALQMKKLFISQRVTKGGADRIAIIVLLRIFQL